jgi:hypothetical protein
VTPYWLMLLFPASLALAQTRRASLKHLRGHSPWLILWFVLTMLVGYRYHVGGDWELYLQSFLEAKFSTFSEMALHGDPAYAAVNWISVQLNWGIIGVNLLCGALFAAGLVYFCRAQPRPWLGIVVAVPYLIIVVAMGYSRQGVAIGLAMIGLTELGKGKNARFMAWIAFAALFHKSAVILAPVVILTAMRNRWWVATWGAATSMLLYVLLLEQFERGLYVGYIEAEYQSEGAAVRVLMNAVPALILLLNKRRLVPQAEERRLWTMMAYLAIGFIALLMVSPSSTAVDRAALYLVPLQLFVWSRVPDLMEGRLALLLTGGVIAYSVLVQYVWLNYAIHASNWIPYRFYPLEAWF